MRVVQVGDPPIARESGPGFGSDLEPMVKRLESQGVEHDKVAGSEVSPGSFAALLDERRPDVVLFDGCPEQVANLVATARSRTAAVVVSMPDYSWICERGTCRDASGTPCLPAVTPGSCACSSGAGALAERNKRLREALRPDDVALLPPTVAQERLVASGVEARMRVLDPAADGGEAHLLAAYADAVAHRCRAETRGSRPALRHVLLVVGAQGSPMRYRVHQKVEQLAVFGISSEIHWYADPRLPHALERSDAVLVYRAPVTRQFVDLIRSARRRGIPTFWDVDDLIFDPETVDDLPIHRHRTRFERDSWIDTAYRYRAMLQECGAGIASTPEIARHMARMGVPAQVLPNGVDTTYSVMFEKVRRNAAPHDRGDAFTVGYCSGSDTHDEDFELVGPALAGFLDAHREARLLLVGPLEVPGELERFADRIESVGWVPGPRVPEHLVRFDLNIAPLVTHDFTNGKSAIKWSEAALVGVPTLAWATEPFRMAIEDGRTGLLAGDTGEFRERLEEAFSDRTALPQMADAARLAAFRQGSPWVLGERLARILGSPERAPVPTRPNRSPSESFLTEVEPAGVIPGLTPGAGSDRAGERLDTARIAFGYPLDKGPLCRVDVQIASWLKPVHSPLELTVRVGRHVLAAATVAPEDAMDNGWVAFSFDPPVPSVRGAVAELSADSSQNVAPYIAREGNRLVNGVRVGGAVMARTFHRPPIPPSFTAPAPASSPGFVLSRIEEWLSVRPRVLRKQAGRVVRRVRAARPRAVRLT